MNFTYTHFNFTCLPKILVPSFENYLKYFNQSLLLNLLNQLF